MRLRTAGAVLLALAVFAACDGSTGDAPAGRAAAGDNAGAAASSQEDAPVNGEPGVTTTLPGTLATAPTTAPPRSKSAPAAASKGSTGGGGSTTTTSPKARWERFSNSTEGYPLEVTLTPLCAKVGDKVTVAVKTRPHSAMAAAVAFSDYDAHGAYTVSDADPAGSWTWTFTITPETPPGEAQAVLSAGDRAPGASEAGGSTNGEGASGRYFFEVGEC